MLLACWTVVLTLFVAEVAFRAIGFDFGRQAEAQRAWPIYYLQPTVPVDEVAFRRPGPQQWTGQVIQTAIRHYGGDPVDYADEPPLTIRYDAEGFRNPDGLRDWEIAVVGDSFVELGYLDQPDLFTTLLGEQLGLRVKNLGVSFTGPLTYAAYLHHFGLSPSTRYAVMVFFEGNDLEDIALEWQRFELARRTGERERREIAPQSSLSTALYRALLPLQSLKSEAPYFKPNARFVAASADLPVTLRYTPPSVAEIDDARREALERALVSWSETARAHGVTPWLLYMPAKTRVLHGLVRPLPGLEPRIRDWVPSDLPEYVQRRSEAHQINFIDATPALVAESRQGRLTYNAVWETHLNRLGSQIVTQTLAAALR
jgi:hypothetical protein